ncbi:MAG: molybdopterin molybdotransferase MoeA [Chloroflexi bacterium]|nr:molybdopterin molybdotransferase MoeA [Chloroflexota bacterium]
MLSVEEARDRVLRACHTLDPERVSMLDSLNRILAEDIVADVDIPPYANSAMDGYAVRASDTRGATRDVPKRLRVIGDLAAGYVADTAVTQDTALRIMTGAPLPEGADAIVRVEDTDIEGDSVNIYVSATSGQFVRPAGQDLRRGERAMERGTLIRPQELGVLAALGIETVSVGRRPRVGILATGDELVEVGEPLAPGKIRNSNSFSNFAQVVQAGGIPVLLGIARDRADELSAKIRGALDQRVDLLITSGGVSVGDFDIVKDILAAEGEIDFWRVRMKPGKPLAFGHIGNRQTVRGDHDTRRIPVIGLPGNPVSAMVSFETFLRPAILQMQGAGTLYRRTVDAVLADSIPDKDDRRHYVRVCLTYHAGQYHAHLTGDQDSGILSSMVKANALAIIPEDWREAPAGSRVEVMLLD